MSGVLVLLLTICLLGLVLGVMGVINLVKNTGLKSVSVLAIIMGSLTIAGTIGYAFNTDNNQQEKVVIEGNFYYPMDLIDGLDEVRFGGYGGDMSSFTLIYNDKYYNYSLALNDDFAYERARYEPFEVQGKKVSVLEVYFTKNMIRLEVEGIEDVETNEVEEGNDEAAETEETAKNEE